MSRLGLGNIAKRLLDDKKVTEDVTPPPHIAPCGMKLPTSGNLSAGQPGQRFASGKGTKPQAGIKAKPAKADPRAKKAESEKPAPKPFEKFFKKRGR